MPLSRYLFLLLSVFAPYGSIAQQGADFWNNATAKPQKVQSRLKKQGNKLKQYKDHLEKWGLDSNYSHGLAIGGRLTSTGWTALVYYQHRLSMTQNYFLQLGFSEIIHEKQIKQQRQNIAYPELGASNAFVFGKINNVYQLQLGYGREQLLLPGLLEGNMTISLRYQAGFSLAMLKPYYLKLIHDEYYPDSVFVREERYTPDNKERFLRTGNVLGASKWKNGLNEINYLPGAFVDVAICIEPLKNKTFIKTVTLGGNFSIHSGDIEIMANQKAYPWNACLYAGLSLGKRWSARQLRK